MYYWDYSSGENPSGPPPTDAGGAPAGGGRPAPPVNTPSPFGQTRHVGAGGGTPTVQANDPRALLGKPVPGRPGYVYAYNAQGQVEPKQQNPGLAKASEYRQQITGSNTPPAVAAFETPTDPAAPATPAPPPTGANGQPFGMLSGSRGTQAAQAAGQVPGYGAAPPAAPATPAPGAAPGAPFTPTQADYSGVNAEMEGLRAARAQFYAQLHRLQGVDPFGNQAMLQKATDRAVAQAAGAAAGARGGAAAQAGAQRAAVGVQSQLAARGAQDVAAQKRADELQAADLGIRTIGGIQSVSGQLTDVELKKIDQMATAAETNLRAYLGGRELDQAERNSLRNFAAEMAKVDLGRYQTDTAYRQSVDDNVTRMLIADKTLEGIMAQIKAGENISGGDVFMGLMGMASGVAGGLAMKSDRRAKTGFAPAKTKDLKDFLASGRGEYYRYREPKSAGARPGVNFGGMAQDLQRTRIGRTVVETKPDGLYVNTGRLALATHGVLGHLAKRLERLEKKVRRAD